MRLPLTYATLLALAAPVAAQSNAERVVNDAYARSHDYDLVHQRIEVRNFDWDSTSLDGRVTTTLVALRAGLDSVRSEEHTSELQSQSNLVCRLLLEKKKKSTH